MATLEAAEQENAEGRKNICLEMKMLHAIHLAVNGTKMGIIQVSDWAWGPLVVLPGVIKGLNKRSLGKEVS